MISGTGRNLRRKMRGFLRTCGKRRNLRFIFLLLLLASVLLYTKTRLKKDQRPLTSLSRLFNYLKGNKEMLDLEGDWGWDESAEYQLIAGDCRIPQVPLNHSGIPRRLAKEATINLKHANCSNERVFSALNSSSHGHEEILLTDETMKAEDCCVREILRPFGHLVTHSFGPCTPLHPVTRSLPVSTMEYILVECRPPSSQPLLNFHVNVPLRGINSVRMKWDMWRRRRLATHAPPPPSVLLLVIDSTSRTELFRSLPLTLQFMQTLGFVDFKGHHPLGEPTVSNMVGMLMGLKNEDFWKAYKLQPGNWWDSAPFLWNLFGKLGYVTGYFEDRSDVSTFYFGEQKGFAHQPTDVFNFPFLAAFWEKAKVDSHRICFGRENAVEMMLNHQLQLLDKLGGHTPSFLVSWPCYPQHDFSHSSLSSMDTAYLAFLRRLRSSPAFLNTLVLITSDHAFVNSHYARTHAGVIERRLMPLFIRLPTILGDRRAGSEEETTVAENLRWNAKGITSHLDVYRTLLHLADMASNELTGGDRGAGGIKKYGESLLRRIPHSRTCAEAGIPNTMCACNLPPILNQVEKVNVSLLQLDEAQFSIPFL